MALRISSVELAEKYKLIDNKVKTAVLSGVVVGVIIGITSGQTGAGIGSYLAFAVGESIPRIRNLNK